MKNVHADLSAGRGEKNEVNMAYGLYYREKEKQLFERSKSKFFRSGLWSKSGIFNPYRFTTIEQAKCYAKNLISRGYETKIKEVK